MESVKRFFFEQFELFFVIVILITISVLVYSIPYKLAFLNFYHIPVLLAAFYLGTYHAMIGAVFCGVIVGSYAYFFPSWFYGHSHNGHSIDSMLQLVIWNCFLILSGAIVGKLNERLKEKVTTTMIMSNELDVKNSLLEQTTERLMDYNNEMQAQVKERTRLLESSKQEIEAHKAKVEQTLYSTMDALVVKLIIEERLATEKRRISLLFSDLEGFTAYAEERGAEIVITDLNAYLQDMEQIVLTYSAHIDKYMGDAIMCEFGAPIHHEHYALLAVCAGYKMQQKAKAGHYPWKMRIGIATGETITGLIGGNKRRSYSALGDTVNLASRIEEFCTPGEVAIDQDTYEQVKGYFELEQQNIFSFNRNEDQEQINQIKSLINQVNAKPGDLELLKELCEHLLTVHEFEKALGFVKKASEMFPDDKNVKLLYADVMLKTEQARDIHVKGRRKGIQIYEVRGLKNPLLQRDDINEALYNRYMKMIDKVLKFPEDLILPVECQDGSIGHARTVGFFSFVLASVMKLSENETRDILEAAYFADLGKTIIPHHVLNRQGTLSEDELNEVSKHSIESVRKLKQIGYESEPVFNIIQCHHENLDGSGYPLGLKGKQIPLGARIVAVADAYSALTSWRPYRSKWNCEAALNQIKTEASRGKFERRTVKALESFIHSVN